ncbi:hypothetical protein MLD38_023443 [Melastoma candidum]|uniref:Uncharacterized protein n=1 Tax=Melastoma candidum TaxID=119954 RepID=A0ACB9NQ75_9MYRT|nr:hypothetical protein MLD38_023443 [Melastoma candidum]
MAIADDRSAERVELELGIGERAISAAGAALLSALLVNPLDVAKVALPVDLISFIHSYQIAGSSCRISTQGGLQHAFLGYAAGLERLSILQRALIDREAVCRPECGQYKGTLDVFYKIIRQEGVSRLWRGTYASLALAVPTVGIYLPCYDIFRNVMEDFTNKSLPSFTPYVSLLAGSAARTLACISCYPIELARTRMQAFKEVKNGPKPSGMWSTLLEVVKPVMSSNNHNSLSKYRILWTGLGAQLARDVPFSAICWSTLEPMRWMILETVPSEGSAARVLYANFAAGFISGVLAAAATCPLDVARTRRQIEKDPTRALKLRTRQTLVEIWRDGGMRGLFAGVGARTARAGPSVGIVVSLYEVVKYGLHERRLRGRGYSPVVMEDGG